MVPVCQSVPITCGGLLYGSVGERKEGRGDARGCWMTISRDGAQRDSE